jgi:hypothetical protein
MVIGWTNKRNGKGKQRRGQNRTAQDRRNYFAYNP